MEKYYHITSYENLESISKNGLVPNRGGRTRSIGDKRNAIFLSLGVQNAILMYSSLLYHYNAYSGERGLKAIEFYKAKIESYHEQAKRIPLDEEDIAELEAIYEAVNWIQQIMKCKDFLEYIDDGVYLTISGIANVTATNPTDCYTDQIIPPEKIKVVVLKNKETGEIVDYREQVLAYFMSVIPIKDVLDKEHNVITIKIIKDLYNHKFDDIRYYNHDNFEIQEIPIDLYVTRNIRLEEIGKRK